MSNRTKDLTGFRSGMLTAIRPVEQRPVGGNWFWLARCDCGTEKLVNGSKMTTGRIESCGCAAVHGCLTHGLTSHPLYYRWKNMMARCYKPVHGSYHDYGGRGITVCEEWHDVRNYIEWADPRYVEGQTVDRIDNDGDYSPDNCRFSNPSVQSINQRRRNNKAGVTGVRRCRNRWQAYIALHGKNTHLGTFDTLLDAAAARISAENTLHRPLLETA